MEKGVFDRNKEREEGRYALNQWLQIAESWAGKQGRVGFINDENNTSIEFKTKNIGSYLPYLCKDLCGYTGSAKRMVNYRGAANLGHGFNEFMEKVSIWVEIDGTRTYIKKSKIDQD